MNDWYIEFPASIVICDKEGKIVKMNETALEVFKDDGGENL